jgi:hypothetical protein
MFTVLNVVASAPSTVTDVELLWASRCIPPRAVVPLIAFVTAISGLCSACATPNTTCTPMMFDSAKVVNMALNAGSGEMHPTRRQLEARYPACFAPVTNGAR